MDLNDVLEEEKSDQRQDGIEIETQDGRDGPGSPPLSDLRQIENLKEQAEEARDIAAANISIMIEEKGKDIKEICELTGIPFDDKKSVTDNLKDALSPEKYSDAFKDTLINQLSINSQDRLFVDTNLSILSNEARSEFLLKELQETQASRIELTVNYLKEDKDIERKAKFDEYKHDLQSDWLTFNTRAEAAQRLEESKQTISELYEKQFSPDSRTTPSRDEKIDACRNVLVNYALSDGKDDPLSQNVRMLDKPNSKFDNEELRKTHEIYQTLSFADKMKLKAEVRRDIINQRNGLNDKLERIQDDKEDRMYRFASTRAAKKAAHEHQMMDVFESRDEIRRKIPVAREMDNKIENAREMVIKGRYGPYNLNLAETIMLVKGDELRNFWNEAMTKALQDKYPEKGADSSSIIDHYNKLSAEERHQVDLKVAATLSNELFPDRADKLQKENLQLCQYISLNLTNNELERDKTLDRYVTADYHDYEGLKHDYRSLKPVDNHLTIASTMNNDFAQKLIDSDARSQNLQDSFQTISKFEEFRTPERTDDHKFTRENVEFVLGRGSGYDDRISRIIDINEKTVNALTIPEQREYIKAQKKDVAEAMGRNAVDKVVDGISRFGEGISRFGESAKNFFDNARSVFSGLRDTGRAISDEVRYSAKEAGKDIIRDSKGLASAFKKSIKNRMNERFHSRNEKRINNTRDIELYIRTYEKKVKALQEFNLKYGMGGRLSLREKAYTALTVHEDLRDSGKISRHPLIDNTLDGFRKINDFVRERKNPDKEDKYDPQRENDERNRDMTNVFNLSKTIFSDIIRDGKSYDEIRDTVKAYLEKDTVEKKDESGNIYQELSIPLRDAPTSVYTKIDSISQDDYNRDDKNGIQRFNISEDSFNKVKAEILLNQSIEDALSHGATKRDVNNEIINAWNEAFEDAKMQRGFSSPELKEPETRNEKASSMTEAERIAADFEEHKRRTEASREKREAEAAKLAATLSATSAEREKRILADIKESDRTEDMTKNKDIDDRIKDIFKEYGYNDTDRKVYMHTLEWSEKNYNFDNAKEKFDLYEEVALITNMWHRWSFTNPLLDKNAAIKEAEETWEAWGFQKRT